MASSNLVLCFLAFLPVFLAATIAGESCEPGRVFPHDPLPGCHAYVLRRCAGDDPTGVRARCCQQLRDVAPSCRCDGVRAMAEVLVERRQRRRHAKRLPWLASSWPCRRTPSATLEAPPVPLGGDCLLQAPD
ncbi:trypsin/factor XIIA inhibitor-like [Phragmites australis]|uniref:trypsin/factor XIIA inhibitor-like n=1 Tax=Phragmites australis TaxID=29695 RepID=UPI002D78FC6A|nr:trypsin/factor XIIA inhibitor-like [Phragmites australis]